MTYRRWWPILAMVAVATMINYLDRTVLGIAAPYLTGELGLTAASLGIVFSAFSWSYALLQIPGGVFLDRFGTRVTYSLALTLWSAFTALMGLVNRLTRPDSDAHRRGRLRGTLLSREQPDSRHLVSATGTRTRQLDLFGRPVRGHRVPERAAVLGHAAVRLARAVFHRRRFRHLLGGCSGSLSRAEREPQGQRRRSSLTSKPAAVANTRASVGFSWSGIGALSHRQILGASIGQFGGNLTRYSSSPGFRPTWRRRGMSFIKPGSSRCCLLGASVGVLVAG